MVTPSQSNDIEDKPMEEPEDLSIQFLWEITDGFSNERRLGEGTFGVVYRGVTKHGEEVAVKKLKFLDLDLDYKQFQNEFYNLKMLSHPNIVQVLGYCYEIEKKPFPMPDGSMVLVEEMHMALCFEYLQNGSLHKYLYGKSCESNLDWHTCFKIIKGTCEGLKYIHKDLKEPMYHLDLKPDNILLDKDMLPKIADFGLSRIFAEGLTRTTSRPYGTLGYQPPEYIDKGEISEKYDIFSLGVIMIRIVSGPESYPKCLDMPSNEFIDQVHTNWRKRLQATSSSDSMVEAYCHQVLTCTQIALNCLEKDSLKRPNIVNITEKLNKTEASTGKVTTNGCHTYRQPSIKLKPSIDMEPIDTRETSVEEIIVGREEEKAEIISSLLKNMSQKIVILPLHGIGGIGKTTIARWIYNDPLFKHYFHAWVDVPKRFDMIKISDSIISQISEKGSQAIETQMVHSCLKKLLPGKKIMIVLDDLWEDNQFKLNELKDELYNDGSDIIILVTTRSERVAERICKNHRPYKILPLTDDLCWDIIKQRSSFESRYDKEQLAHIGPEIAKKCGGVALAARSLGFTLRDMNFDQWIDVKNNEIWNEHTSNDSLPNQVLASLMLSYRYMEQSLQPCFTYCAVFPKGHKILRKDLVYQWISLGFIRPNKLLSDLQLCEKYIVQLLGQSFLQVSPKPSEAYDKNATEFTMHDLVHDLAISLLGNQILDQSRKGNTRGSSCQYALLADCSKALELCLTSRARLIALRFLECCNSKLRGAAFAPARSLRVLDLSECSIQKLPDSIGELKQLRYLKAPGIQDQFIPNCITKLSELNYLDISGSEISALPETIGEMTGLVYLDISYCSEITQLPGSFMNLENLVHLDLSGCSHITGVSESLGSLRRLQHLDLSFCTNIGEELPDALGSHTELQYLNLSHCSYLQVRDAEVLGNLSKLKYLNLSSQSSPLRRLPGALGSFTELEYLNLSGCEQLEELPTSFGKLCSLVQLNLSDCRCLNNIWDALKYHTKLQRLSLEKCSISVFKQRQQVSSKGLQEAMSNLTELRFLNLSKSLYLLSGGQPVSDSSLGWISNLTNLEHLVLSSNHDLHTVPDVFGELKKLHTLDLSNCSLLQWLPKSISEIDSLKFLNTMGCDELDKSTLPQFKSSSVLLPHFVVRTSDGESSSNLVLLKDENPTVLEICRLENVKSVEEAQMINMVEKQMINELKFEWTGDAKRFVEDIEVLAELVPPSNLQIFELQGYNSSRFPSWMMCITSYLPQLGFVTLDELPWCRTLPPLGQLPNLLYLQIKKMHSIRKIGGDLYGGPTAFRVLKRLYLECMDNLQEWNTIGYSDEDGANVLVLPMLEELFIEQCPKLSFKPCCPIGGDSCHIESDEAISSEGERASSATLLHQCRLVLQLPALRFLVIENCMTSSSLDILRGLSSLKRIRLSDCKSITAFPDCLGDLTSLKQLCISNCPGIKRLPESIKQLPNLQDLIILDCPDLDQWCESDEKIKKLCCISDDESGGDLQTESDEEVEDIDQNS